MILFREPSSLGGDHSGILVLQDGPEPGTPLADVLPLSEQVLEVDDAEPAGPALDLRLRSGGRGDLRRRAPLDAGNRPRARRRRARGHSDRGSRALPMLAVGRTFRDVRIGPSPTWLKGRLIVAGMRPISNVVDATNYAMLALGSLLHAFDQSRLAEGASSFGARSPTRRSGRSSTGRFES